jgi:hypothetical protein
LRSSRRKKIALAYFFVDAGCVEPAATAKEAGGQEPAQQGETE